MAQLGLSLLYIQSWSVKSSFIHYTYVLSPTFGGPYETVMNPRLS